MVRSTCIRNGQESKVEASGIHNGLEFWVCKQPMRWLGTIVLHPSSVHPEHQMQLLRIGWDLTVRNDGRDFIPLRRQLLDRGPKNPWVGASKLPPTATVPLTSSRGSSTQSTLHTRDQSCPALPNPVGHCNASNLAFSRVFKIDPSGVFYSI